MNKNKPRAVLLSGAQCAQQRGESRGGCSVSLAALSCWVHKFLSKAQKNPGAPTEFLNLGIKQDVKQEDVDSDNMFGKSYANAVKVCGLKY